MIWIHRIAWAGMALIAFMIVPVIKAEAEVIEKLAVAKGYIGMSVQQLQDQNL